MASKTTPQTQEPKTLKLKLTEEQKREILKFIKETRNASLDVGVEFEADINKATIAPSTFLVGNAF